jgi:hypothetical protein
MILRGRSTAGFRDSPADLRWRVPPSGNGFRFKLTLQCGLAHRKTVGDWLQSRERAPKFLVFLSLGSISMCESSPRRTMGSMADDAHDSIQYKNDPENCDHSRVSVRRLGAIQNADLDSVTPEWGTCQDCGKRVPNPAPRVGGSTGAADDRP